MAERLMVALKSAIIRVMLLCPDKQALMKNFFFYPISSHHHKHTDVFATPTYTHLSSYQHATDISCQSVYVCVCVFFYRMLSFPIRVLHPSALARKQVPLFPWSSQLPCFPPSPVWGIPFSIRSLHLRGE